MSGFPLKKGLTDFDFSFQPSIDKRQIEELATMRFLENAENVVFLGPPGVGKTHLATALGLEAARFRLRRITSTVTRSSRVWRKLISRTDFPNACVSLASSRCSSSTKSAICLWISRGANLFFQLIARRYEKASTIFTSNKTFSQWNDIFADVTIASAVLDRVLHHCTVIHIKGESYRLKEQKEYLRQKIQATNALFEPASWTARIVHFLTATFVQN
jgi:DNA replication protein DnaC